MKSNHVWWGVRVLCLWSTFLTEKHVTCSYGVKINFSFLNVFLDIGYRYRIKMDKIKICMFTAMNIITIIYLNFYRFVMTENIRFFNFDFLCKILLKKTTKTKIHKLSIFWENVLFRNFFVHTLIQKSKHIISTTIIIITR